MVLSLFFWSAVFAQDTPNPPREGPTGGPENRPGRPSVPRIVKNNDQFKQWAADFQDARDTFKSKLAQMREALIAASDQEKDAVRQQIRDHLRQHRQEQLEFRKKVRRLMTGLRKTRTVGEEGPSG